MKRLNIKKDGKEIFPIGVNYWASHAGHLMWRNWNPERVDRDMAILENLGMNTVRSFFLTADLAPYPGEIKESELKKFEEFLNICQKHNINVLPSIFIGHMSGTNWDIPWRNGRDFCGDTFMIYHQANLVRTLADRFKGHPSIMAWILSNELPNYTGSIEPEKAAVWLRAMYQAVKEGDPDALVSPGDGARTTAKKDYDGFRVEWIKDHVDYFGVHLYSYFDYEGGDNDALRLSYQIPCRIRYVQVGKPVLLEEFGLSDLLSGREKATGYYRNVLYSSWANGSCGAVSWCFSDFDLKEEPPYEYQPHELYFGIVDKDGKAKPTGQEMAKFAKFAKDHDINSYHPEQAKAALLIPYWMYQDMTSHGSVDRLQSYRIFEQAFTWSKMAGFELDFIRNIDEIKDYKLIILPTIARLKSIEWIQLQKWVEKGGTLYLSYSSANGGFLVPNSRELFGLEIDLTHGLLKMNTSGSVNYKVNNDFGLLSEGEMISSVVADIDNYSGTLPVHSKEADTILTDEKGQLLLLRNKVKKGTAFFATRPLEYDMLRTPAANEKTSSYYIYRTIADAAGIKIRWEGKPAAWEINRQIRKNEELLVIINHLWETQESVITDEEKDFSLNLKLGPQAVVVFKETDKGWKQVHTAGDVSS